MAPTRRDFVKAASAAALAVGGSRLVRPMRGLGLDAVPHAGDPLLRELAARALEAARSAGASYADVRFTLTRSEDIRAADFMWFATPEEEHGAVGVRALADGAWGFAASPVFTADEVARLGAEAAAMAKQNARGGRRRVELDPPPPPATGEWTTPIARDPFTVPLAEKVDVIRAFHEVAMRMDSDVELATGTTVRHRRQEKTFASTDGAFVTQTLYLSHPWFSIAALGENGGRAMRWADRLQPAAGGWEVYAGSRIVDDIPRLIEEVTLMLDAEPVQPDRYDVVFDGLAVGQILGQTVGVAAELDRVLGFEANAGGTSYLAPPDEKLGAFRLGPDLLNITANRSRPGGPATVQWDDEGVRPDDYPLVRGGVLVDYHTTRELAGTLASYYGRVGRPARSHGCASGENALAFTLLQPPNIELVPGTGDATLDDLVAGLDHGLVIVGGVGGPGGGSNTVFVDRQQLNGEVDGNMVYEVRKGKRTGFIRNSEVLFRAPEFWKSLTALGGRRSQTWSGLPTRKGQPVQEFTFGCGAPPALFTKVAVTNLLRKA